MPKQSYLTLQAQIKKLQDKADSLRAKQRGPVIASIMRSMRDYDISIDEVATALEKPTTSIRKIRGKPAGGENGTKVRRPVAPKYRHPDTAETWSGRGKAPRWLVAAESAGTQRDHFLITE